MKDMRELILEWSKIDRDIAILEDELKYALEMKRKVIEEFKKLGIDVVEVQGGEEQWQER